jgi:hypothetical protein
MRFLTRLHQSGLLDLALLMVAIATLVVAILALPR